MARVKPALTVPLQGGLGNQLFELAAGIALTARHRRPVRFSDHWLRHPVSDETPRDLALDGLLRPGELTSAPAPRVGGITDRLLALRVVERSADDDALTRVRRTTRTVAGYFQRLDYVREAWPELRSRFAASTREAHRAFVVPVADDVGTVHYRLGDYLLNPAARQVHGLTSPEFFAAAIRKAHADLGVDRWRVVSDDPATALELLGAADLPDAVRLEASSGTDEWEDLRTLASARVCVLSNSSFSWWAGFLGDESHGMRVVTPQPWFNDPATAEPSFFPAGWERRPRAVLPT